jgi:hypothetical protein
VWKRRGDEEGTEKNKRPEIKTKEEEKKKRRNGGE